MTTTGITTQDEIPYLREPEFLALLRSLLAQGDYDASLALSKRLLHQAETGSKRVGRVIEVLVLQALIYQSIKDPDLALAALKRLFRWPDRKGISAPSWMKVNPWSGCYTSLDRNRLRRSMLRSLCLYLKRPLVQPGHHPNF